VPERKPDLETESILSQTVGDKADRKLKARHEKKALWFGLGMFGLIGWAITIPTVLGIALGVWIDNRYPSRFSWTLMLMVAGVFLGCLNAWHWLKEEADHD